MAAKGQKAGTRSQAKKGQDMASLEHIIVLMLENNSFDRMLGALFPERAGGGGIKGTAGNHWNDDSSLNPPVRHQMAPTTTRQVLKDPGHELSDTLAQLQGPCKGFVGNFVAKYPNSAWADRQEIMGYYADGQLPSLHRLAKAFTVCDRWFSSMPGPTWPNRVFVHTGTSLGYTTNSMGNNWDQRTLYEAFDDLRISWKIYHGDGDISQTSVLRHSPWVYPMKNFFKDIGTAETRFQKYTFIEPHFGTLNKTLQNDQHPPSDVRKGDALIANVYDALRANDALWQKSLLLITYDEHGGFYDHVDPPATVPPDNGIDASKFDFKKLGVRVPTVLVSPWLDQGVIQDTFDHTSLLKFVCDKWSIGNQLGNRVASASTNTFAKYIRKQPRNTSKVLSKLSVPATLPPLHGTAPTDHQEALIELGRSLASRVADVDLRNQLLLPPAGPGDGERAQQAVERFEAFLLDKATHEAVSGGAKKRRNGKRSPRSKK
jgi:phospholipase C